MAKLVVWLIHFYQKYLNFEGFLFRFLFLTDQACRFSPTCSEYTVLAVARFGVVRGLRLGLARVLKCHPWSPGGWDPVN